jgi:protein tyrosine/serine phosphatase
LKAPRVLAWDGCVNVRDLGGLPTEDGAETRFGVVVRADSIRGLTAEGWDALVFFGVRRAIDLRADREVAADPPGDAPIPVVRVPIVPWETTLGDHWPSMREGYMVVLEDFRDRFARVVDELAASDCKVVIHCMGGRDRTGLAVALVLRVAGVAPGTIAEDHAESDGNWAPLLNQWLAEAKTPQELERRRRISAPAGTAMVDVLAELERRYGSVPEYLIAAGANDEAIREVRRRLRP